LKSGGRQIAVEWTDWPLTLEKQTTRCRLERRRLNESLTSFPIAPLRAALLGSRTASFGQMAAAFEINLNSM